MAEDLMRYDRLVEDALRGVVRKALLDILETGLPGEHHFYITFRSQSPGVVMPDSLRETYPNEMTIVLQHQYWDLEIEERQFSVALSFNNVRHHLVVPFDAVVAFADPSVRFGLQFEYEDEDNAADDDDEVKPSNNGADAQSADGPDDGDVAQDGSKIVTLDSFRKK